MSFTAKPTLGGKTPVFKWQLNGSDVGSSSAIYISNSLKNGDVVTCTLFSSNNCIEPTLSNALQMSVDDPAPSIAISTANTRICPGALVTFTAVITGGGSAPVYQWQVNGINTGGNLPTYTSSALANNDVITCTLSIGSACVAPVTSAAIKINTINVVVQSVTIKSSVSGPVCAGTSVSFTATPAYINSSTIFRWLINGIPTGTNNPIYTSNILNNGDVVTCMVIGGNSCAMPVISLPITMLVLDAPTIAIKNITLTKGNSVTLNPVVKGEIETYTWSPATGLSATNVKQPIASPAFSTTYTLTVKTTGGCSTSMPVTVNVVVSIVIPDAFTPNGDGINDLWSIPALANYPDCSVNVYNRYGLLVYHSTGYPRDWDGTYKNSALPYGTYYYIIDPKANVPKLSGYVTIIR